MSDIQSVQVTSYELKKEPKPHVVYNVKVSTPTRTWTVQRRYNDFVALNVELTSSTGKKPPAELPGKHPFSFTRKVDDEQLTTERRVALDAYLRAILTHKDPRWRKAYTFSDFLSIPSNAGPSSSSSRGATGSSYTPTAGKLSSFLPVTQADGPVAETHFTSSSWLAEHTSLQHAVRNVRSALLKRDTLAQLGDASASRSAGVEAKRMIRDVRAKLDSLERGLGNVEGLGQGERSRREGLVSTLKDDLDNVDKMAEAGVKVSQPAPAGYPSSSIFDSSGSRSSRSSTPVNESARSALLGSSGTPPPSFAPPSRVFGAAAKPHVAQETSDTRPLDDQQLLVYQRSQMNQQDAQLEGLSAILQRQKMIGQEIGREVGEQNEMLDGLTGDLDKTGAKLGRTKREMNRLGK